MLTLNIDYNNLLKESILRDVPIVRVLFDDHIYKEVSRTVFEVSSKGHNNGIIKISDNGFNAVEVRIKTEGVDERIGT